MTASRWARLVRDGIAARREGDRVQWVLGDLAVNVETTWGGQELQRYAEAIGVEYSTLRDYRTVALTFAERSAKVSWSHHQVLAARPDRAEWIARTAREGWSVARLREALTSADGARSSARSPSPAASAARTLRRTDAGVTPPPPLHDGTLAHQIALEIGRAHADEERPGLSCWELERRTTRQHQSVAACLTGMEKRGQVVVVPETFTVVPESGKAAQVYALPGGNSAPAVAQPAGMTEEEMYPEGEPPGTEDADGWAAMYAIERIAEFKRPAAELARLIHSNQAYRIDRDLPIAVAFINEFAAEWGMHHA